MEAGYELDKAVAEACGFECCDSTLFFGKLWARIDGFDRPFRPSTDWNDLLLAIKKCGVMSIEVDGIGGDWGVEFYLEDSDERRVRGKHAIETVAGCLAILKLKGVTT